MTVPVADAGLSTLPGFTETEAKAGDAVTVIEVVVLAPFRNAVIVSATEVVV